MKHDVISEMYIFNLSAPLFRDTAAIAAAEQILKLIPTSTFLKSLKCNFDATSGLPKKAEKHFKKFGLGIKKYSLTIVGHASNV